MRFPKIEDVIDNRQEIIKAISQKLEEDLGLEKVTARCRELSNETINMMMQKTTKEDSLLMIISLQYTVDQLLLIALQEYSVSFGDGLVN